jgi:hypothetical protein
MYLDFKKKLFGRNFNFELEARPLAEEVYNLKLYYFWVISRLFHRSYNRYFIYNALRHLPPDFFIIFSFDQLGKSFVQFANIKGKIILDIPCWDTNPYFGKGKKILNMLDEIHFRRCYMKNLQTELETSCCAVIPVGKNRKDIRANFGYIYISAAVFALQIAETIFKRKRPHVTGYYSQKLVPILRE